MSKIAIGKDKEVFEKEMRQAQIAEGLAKIEEVRKNPDAAEAMQNTTGKTLVEQKKQKDRNKKLHEKFEMEFLNQNQKKPPSFFCTEVGNRI